MASRKGLRTVSADERPLEREVPKTVGEAVESSERDVLVSLRRHLAQEMDAGKVPAHALASVSAKIREYDREIRALDARQAEEAKRRESSAAEDGVFDSSAV